MKLVVSEPIISKDKGAAIKLSSVYQGLVYYLDPINLDRQILEYYQLHFDGGLRKISKEDLSLSDIMILVEKYGLGIHTDSYCKLSFCQKTNAVFFSFDPTLLTIAKKMGIRTIDANYIRIRTNVK